MLWVTSAAAAYVLLPASLKWTTQVPDPVKVTLPEEIVQPVDALASVTATVSLDVAVALAA
jgi:hypothetical protein